jgi:hypothetical protein
VRDEATRREAVRDVAAFAEGLGFVVVGEAESRVHGPRGTGKCSSALLEGKRKRFLDFNGCGR